MTLKKIKMSQCNVAQRNGRQHRKCSVVIPKKFSDHYPDDQVFEVRMEGRKLVYAPVQETVPAWQYDESKP